MGKCQHNIARVRILALLALIVSLAAAPRLLNGQSPLELTTVREIRALNQDQAQKARPVRLRGVVTVLSGYKNSFFFLDGTAGISVDRTTESPELEPGQRVELRGVANPGLFAPTVVAQSVTILGKGILPPPRLFQMDELTGGREDSQWIAIRGVVRSAAVQPRWGRPVLVLEIDIGAGNLAVVHVYDFSAPGWERLPGATVRLRGVCGTVFNDRRQFVGIRMFVSNLGDVKVEKPAPANPFDIPSRALDNLLQFGDREGAIQRVKVEGAVTYAQPGLGMYIQNGQVGVFVKSDQATHVSLGSPLEVVGFPTSGRSSPFLDDAIYRVTGAPRSIAAVPGTVSGMIVVNQFGFSAAPFDSLLVQLKGRLLEEIRGPKEDRLLLKDGESFFTARMAESGLTRTPLPAGTVVSVTGVCVTAIDEAHEARSFEMLLRSPADIVVLEKVPWWNAKHAGWVVALFCVVLFVALGSLGIAKRHSELQALAMTDPLTGLYNRRGFFVIADHQWRAALRRKTTLLLLYMDIDNFKEINDSLGHKEGDLVLRNVAVVLRECFRRTDIIARMGGDEFVVTCEAPPESRATLEARISRALEICNKDVGSGSPLSLSIGMLTCDATLGALSIGDLLTKADELMYRQKREHQARKA